MTSVLPSAPASLLRRRYSTSKESPGLHLALEIDVVRIKPDQVFDHRAGQVVAQRRLVDALVEPDAGAVILLVVARRPPTSVLRHCGRRPATYLPSRRARPPLRAELSLATMTRIGCTACRPAPPRAGRAASGLPSGAVAAAGPSTLRLPWCPGARRRLPAGSSRGVAFLDVMARSFQLLPPVVCFAVFGRQVMFSGTMRASKPA